MDKDLRYSHLKRAGILAKYHIRVYSLSPMRLPITVPCPTHQVRILKAGKILVWTTSQTSIWYPNIVVAVFLRFWIWMRCIFSLNTSTKLILKSQGMVKVICSCLQSRKGTSIRNAKWCLWEWCAFPSFICAWNAQPRSQDLSLGLRAVAGCGRRAKSESLGTRLHKAKLPH